MYIELAFRFLLAGLLGLAGWHWGRDLWAIIMTLGGAAAGFFIAPYLSTKPVNWLALKLTQMPTSTLIVGIMGLLIALLMAALLTLPLSLLPGAYGRVVPVVISIFLCYTIISLMLRRSGEIFRLLGLSPDKETRGRGGTPILVDTSALVDGRIADVTQTGFIMGQLVIPTFVLRELQQIADSTDHLKRRRGRRGMDILSRLQNEAQVPVRIEEMELGEGEGVDSALVRVAKKWRCPVLTTDFNLNRIAEIQGVRVLNLNSLASTLKPTFLPGEEMEVQLVQEGKEAGQGVGFLDDGTMVVVEGGKRLIPNKVEVVVTRVLQTATGRIIFAQPKNSGYERK